MTEKRKYDKNGFLIRLPKRDGSGRGIRANIGRGECAETEPIGKGFQAPPIGRGGLGRVLGFGRGYFRKWREAISKKD